MKTEPIFSSRLEPLVDESQDQFRQDNHFRLPSLTSDKKIIDLKDLDKWDEQHLKIKSQGKSLIINRKATNLLQKSSLMCLNYKGNASSNFSSLKSSFINDKVKDFYRNIQQETSSLLAQNINMVKKRFDFDIFRKKNDKFQLRQQRSSQKTSQEELYQIGNELAVRKMASTNNSNENKYTTSIDNDEEINIQNRILKQNNLKLEGKYQKVVSSDYYKEIVKNKNILEKAYRKEIKSVSKEIDLADSEIQQLNNDLKTLYTEIEEKKRKYYDNRDVYNILKSEKDSSALSKKDFMQSTKGTEAVKQLKAQINKLKADYDEQRIENGGTIDFIKTEMNELKIGIKTLQVYKKSIIKQLIDYYYQILKEGVDVRSIGICWVLTRIYEFGIVVSNSDFPKFLEYISVNYLKEYSQKAIIKKKLNVVLGLLVKKYLIYPKSEETKRNEEITQINHDYSGLENIGDFIQEMNQKFKNKLVNQNELIIRKDKEIFLKSVNQLRTLAMYQDLLMLESNLKNSNEEGDTAGEQRKRKRRKRDCDSFEETKEDLNASNHNREKVEAMTELFNQREIVDACSHIRLEIKKIDNEMRKMKEMHMKFFKKKHECCKLKGISECVKYDLMYCALFGNYAVV